MAHEIETMAYANEVPWHGLGARVDGDVSVDEMLEAAGLNWSVNLHPLHINIDDKSIPVPDRFALVRETDHKILTITGKSWNPLQNREMLGLMSDYVEAGGATLETAGSLRGGKIVWGLARLNHNFEVTKGDRVNGYLLITSPHEVGKAITVRTTTVRVVCANTMAMAERNSNVNYKQNHLSAFNFANAKAAIALAHEDLAAAEKRAKTISGLKLSLEDTVIKVLVPTMFPELSELDEFEVMDVGNQPKSLQQIIDSIHNAPGAIPDNGWGVLNGVTHWADHVTGHNNATRMFRSWIGDTGRMKLEVENRLLELAA
jgi:phage/plasmid-like protein (TIGR03299 family)